MNGHMYSHPTAIQTMSDGTIKQVNPFSGTEVWTVPGRGHRPLSTPHGDVTPISPHDHTNTCAFCSDRYLDTPPEKARIVCDDADWTILRGVLPDRLYDSVPAFRRVSNLFEIVSYDYWRNNYGFSMDRETTDWMQSYISTEKGREHVLATVRTKLKAAGIQEMPDVATLLSQGEAFFGGGHDLIIGQRHFVPDATRSDQLASAGTLSPEEHFAFIFFTVDALREAYQRNRYAPYVAVFQNWLKPAGASFDHLHKQLVAIDERGVHGETEIAKLRNNPNMYNEWAVDYAGQRNLIIAENDHAVCFAGFGHRYPTLEVFSRSATPEPWLQTTEEIKAMSDLIHACHAAAGPQVPCNEEWHHKPIDLDIAMPWRVMIKWRVSTLAGFEGSTKVYLNTLSPWDVRDRIVPRLYELRDSGAIDGSIRIATECSVRRNSLLYNKNLNM
ncbi:DUF4921 family protein [Corynebacterium rouxii]|uniref:DUF4921 family protein n=1 Tax=Corynebacterium rouxii TaxID=2719119 RepID=UPI00313BF758